MVWSKIWKDLGKDPQTILKNTSIDKGFSGECYDLIKSKVPPQAKNILEVGCGTGRFLIKLAEEHPKIFFKGSDISPESIKLAQAGAELRQLKNIKFSVDDMTKPNETANSYDMVYNEGSVEHFRKTKDKEILKKLLNLVKPGGLLLFGVPNYRCYVHTINKALAGPFYRYGYERSYKKETLQDYLSELGLSETDVKGIGLQHGWQRYGFPYTLFVKKYLKMKEKDPKKAQNWNEKYGFFLFASGKKRV